MIASRAGTGLLLLALLSGCTAAEEQQEEAVTMGNPVNTEQPDEVVAGEIIVKFRAGTVTPMGTLTQMRLQQLDRTTSGGEVILRLNPPDGITSLSVQAARTQAESAVAVLRRRPDVEYAQLNRILRHQAGPRDPLYRLQWQLYKNGSGAGLSPAGMNAEDVWSTNTGNGSVVVAVIDNGILPMHRQIAASANLVRGYDFITDTRVSNDGDGRDPDPTDPGDACAPDPDSWHGTHVAGIVGAGKTDSGLGMAGVIWRVKVQPVRVLGVCGGELTDINDAIRWAAGMTVPNVPDNLTPARVINLSLGGRSRCSDNPSTQAAIDDVVRRGVTVIVAAGNDAMDVSGFTPAGCNNVVTVAASDARGNLAARYSNYGAGVTILAPGGDVLRDDNGDGVNDGIVSMVKGGYAAYEGTSMAAPSVSGVVALWLSADPSLNPASIRAALTAKAIPRKAGQCSRPCGAGLLNAVR